MISRHARYLRATRFPSLDGLRCVAVVPVFWHHCTTGPLPGILGRGPLGVDLFFAISGFLITTLLLRERDSRTGSDRIGIGAFYARRSLRIFPLYYGVLALYVVNAWRFMPGGPQREHFLGNLPFFATYTTNWLVDFAVPHAVSFAFAWSLATEEQFYLLWPWVLWVSRRTRWALPTVVALALLALHEAVAHDVLPLDGLSRRIVGSLSPPICMGALLALVFHAPRGFAVASRLLGVRAAAPLLFALLLFFASVDGVPLWLAQGGLALLVAACAVRPDHGLAWLTDLPAMRWVGTVSYGIYLFHVGLITGARRVLPAMAPSWTFFLVFPLTVAVASASYVWLERPILALRSRFAVTA